MNMQDRLSGCFWGLVVGDALGAPIEFYPRDRHTEVRDMISGGKFNLPVGGWTDDTSMALCLAHSLIKDRNLDSADLLNRFWGWASKNEHCSGSRAIGFGQNTLRSLSRFNRTGQLVASSNGRSSDGNGTIMRLAPLPIVHNDNLNALRQLARTQSYTTHASEKAADCCELLSIILHQIFQGVPFKESYRAAQNTAWNPEVIALSNGDWAQKNRDEISSEGYVVHTLEAALWSIHTTHSFEEALIKAVNLGHDADTVGAVTGQIAGALYGVQNIPARWKDALVKSDHLENTLTSLLTVSDGWVI